jgi:carboxyl-terminal processing protease
MILKAGLGIVMAMALAGTAAWADDDGGATDPGDPKGWTKTHINLSTLYAVTFKTYPCQQNAIYMNACVQGLNALGANMKPMQMLLPKNALNLYPGLKITPVRETGGYLLAKVDGSVDFAATREAQLDRDKKTLDANLSAAQISLNAKDFQIYTELGVLLSQMPSGPGAKDPRIIYGEVINEVAGAVDGHGRFSPREVENQNMTHADFAGIGAVIGKLDNQGVAIMGFVDDESAALKAGVQEGDVILRVEDQDVTKKSTDEVRALLLGKEGTPLHVDFGRKDQVIHIQITRALVKNVTHKVVHDMGKDIGYIRIRSFEDTEAYDSVSAAIGDLNSKKVSAMILDLRGNPGGLLDRAVGIAELFVGPKPIVLVRNVHGADTDSAADPEAFDVEQTVKVPTAVLINSDSASASEVVSGALQDYKRAWIVGERSWGKATVQDIDQYRYEPELDYIHTVQRFFQPLDHTNQLVGIQPDFEVFPVPHPTAEEKERPREETYVLNALPAYGKPWVQTRQAEIDDVRARCLSGHWSERLYNALGAAYNNDLQLFTAEEILACPAAASK